MDSPDKVTLAPPVIEDRPTQRIAGFSDHLTWKTMDTIPHIWGRLGPYMPELGDGGPPCSFGVNGPMSEASDGFDYFAAVPLAKGKDLPPGLIETTLPAGSYARYTHEGHISKIRASCAALFDAIPLLGRETDHRWFSFLEYYGPDFEPSTGLGTVELWVKLK